MSGEVAFSNLCWACGVVDPYQVAGFYDEFSIVVGVGFDVKVFDSEGVVDVKVVIFHLALNLGCWA